MILHQQNSEIRDLNIENTNISDYIKSTKIYKDIYFISNIDSDILLKKLKQNKNYNNLIIDFSLIFLRNKNSNYEKNFTDYIEVIKNKNKKLLDKIKNIYCDFDIEEFDREIDYDKYEIKKQ